MAISGGKIIGIGSLADLEGLTNASTTTVKPEGIVIPGLIEPHMHMWTSLLNLTWTDVSKEACDTFDDVVATIKQTAAKTPDGQWVLGKLFDPSLYPGEPDLTRTILDQVSPNNPVMVMNASMHYLYVNSPAMVAAGVTDQTMDPPGGTFGRADGKLTGIIGEAGAMMVFAGKLPKPTQADLASGITTILNECARQGVTSLREAATGTLAGVSELAMLHQLNGAQRLPAGFQPFVEHLGLEQRSREVREDKVRIRFAREEPAAQERQTVGFFRRGRSRAARNLRPFQAVRRDVLKIQRTGPGHQVFRVKIRRTEEKELGIGGSAGSHEGVGDAGRSHRSKELI
jgi:predicted amidohydrolase YtcJ